ncbi:MAG: SRPBCC family protein [Anaerolineae bacterium]
MQALVTVTESIRLSVAPDELWPFLSDANLVREWRQGLEQFGRGDLPAMGETLPITQQVLRRRLSGEAVLLQLDAGRALSYELGRPGSGYLAVRYDLWPQKTGCKLAVSQTVDAPSVPLLGSLLGRLFIAPRLRDEQQRDLARLRQRVGDAASAR